MIWRRIRLTGMVLVVAVLAAACSDDGPKKAGGDGTTTTAKLELDKEAEALFSLLDKARDLTFHASYSATNAQQETFQIQIWRKGGLVRQDVTAMTEGKPLLQSAFVLKQKAITCSKLDVDPWQCSDIDNSNLTKSDGVFGAVRDQLGGIDVTQRDDKIAERDVTCFQWQFEGDKGEMCVLKSGIPARATIGPTTISLTSDQSDVGDDVFQPPVAST